MESVIVTVSGYQGTERFNLIKLINHAGASYIGSMSSLITHLVCWKFEGKKYEIATRSGTVVVNHRWIEDCVKQGKRVPEGPYMLQSGEEVGPILLEVPDNLKHSFSVKNQRVLFDQTNTCYGSENRSDCMGFETSGDSVLRSSSLFSVNLFPGGRNEHGNSSHKSKQKLVRRASEKAQRSSSRLSLQELPLRRPHRNRPVESISKFTMDLTRDKRKSFDDNRSTTPESLPKGRRRLVKKNKNREIVELLTSDSDQDCCPSRINSPSDDLVVLSDHIGEIEHDNVSINERNESLKDDAPNRISSSMDANGGSENALTTSENISEAGCSGAENSKEEMTGHEIKNDSDVPSSRELSCVICWTDFSSTRGVLPCGHRFCYPCIENWADHMASRRKISTCPLCKTGFESILKFDDPTTTDQKIYSQTIPCGLSKTDMFILPHYETPRFSAQSESGPVCSICCNLEPEDLLIACNLCQVRRIHSYCLDPPVDPWTCSDCNELQRLYLLNH